MGVAAADVPHARHPVAFARHVAGGEAGRHALAAQHDRQRRRDLLAEAELRLEQEVVDGVGSVGGHGSVEVVLGVGAEPGLVGEDRVVGRLPGRAQRGREVDRPLRRRIGQFEEPVQFVAARHLPEPGEELAEVALGAQDVGVHLQPLGDHRVHRASGERHVRAQRAVGAGPQRAVEDHLHRPERGEHDVGEILLDEVGLDQLAARHRRAEGVTDRGWHVDHRSVLWRSEIR